MVGCHKKKAKSSINNIKSSVFCGVKGFLTFSLAFLSYLEYSNYIATQDIDTTINQTTKEESTDQ